MKQIAITLLLGTLCVSTAQAQNDTDAAALLYLKQEEKLARDVYKVLGNLYAHPTFLNIARSEQRHMDSVDRLIRFMGLTDPTPAAPGEFSIAELQQLHDSLVITGGQSLEDALAVGVLIEVTDIEDITEMLAATQDPVMRRVLTNLQNGSYKHLDAFNRALEQPDSATCQGGTGRDGRRGRQGDRLGNCDARTGTCLQPARGATRRAQQSGAVGRQAGRRGSQGPNGERQTRYGKPNPAAGNGGVCVQDTPADPTTPQRRRSGR